MALTLFLPGLIWPGSRAQGLLDDLPLPAFSALVARARLTRTPGQSRLDALLEAFGLGQRAAGLARWRAIGDGLPAAGDYLCADPVHLRLTRDHLLLADLAGTPGLALSETEAQALIDRLNAHFGEHGQFVMGTPARWYLSGAAPAGVRFVPLADVAGRPVAHHLPTGDDAARWHRLMNEAQVVLHNAPENQAREASGRPAFNSLWLWGMAPPERPMQRPRAPAAQLFADDPLIAGLARDAGQPLQTPAALQARLARGQWPDEESWCCLETLQGPSLAMALDAWRAGLAELEQTWFAPLLDRLRAAPASATLRLVVPDERGSLQLLIKAHDRHCLWRRPRTLSTLIQPPDR